MNSKPNNTLPLCECHGISKEALKAYYILLKYYLGGAAPDIMRHMIKLFKPRANIIWVCQWHHDCWITVGEMIKNHCNAVSGGCNGVGMVGCIHADNINEVKNNLTRWYDINFEQNWITYYDKE